MAQQVPFGRHKALLSLLLLSGCAGSATVDEYLDARTGATVRRVSESLVFSREASQSAAHARDLITLAPLEINRAGEHQAYLWVARWSAVRDRQVDAENELATLFFVVDDEPIELPQTTTDAREIGLGELIYESPTSTASIAYFTITGPQLLRIAKSSALSLATEDGGRSYTLWSRDADTMSAYETFANTIQP